MLKKVLVISPNPGFGGLIRQLLKDTGGFTPFIVSDAIQASHLAQKEALALTILDADLGIKDLPAFVAELRQHAPQTRLIVAPAKDNPKDPQLSKLEANAILPSPFYLPDLVTAIEQLFGPLVPGSNSSVRRVYGKPTDTLKIERNAPKMEVAPEWLEDITWAASYLARLSLESASRAALITRGEKVWAYAGALPELAVDELARAVAKHALDDSTKDLARFIHLSATNAEYMMYATNLGGEFQLALVFDAQMPFSQMRSHVGRLAKALAIAPDGERKIEEPVPVMQERPETKPEQRERPRPEKIQDVLSENKPSSVSSTKISNEVNRPAIVSRSPTGPLRGSNIYYSFVFIPRLPKHKLLGDLAASLPGWVAELSLAFAWRLEGFLLRPEFMGWSVGAPPRISPENIAETMSNQLSHRVFQDVPRLAQDNPSGQFWAPDPLVVSGPMPNPAQIIEFIRQTRKRQGAIR